MALYMLGVQQRYPDLEKIDLVFGVRMELAQARDSYVSSASRSVAAI